MEHKTNCNCLGCRIDRIGSVMKKQRELIESQNRLIKLQDDLIAAQKKLREQWLRTKGN